MCQTPKSESWPLENQTGESESDPEDVPAAHEDKSFASHNSSAACSKKLIYLAGKKFYMQDKAVHPHQQWTEFEEVTIHLLLESRDKSDEY